MEVSGQEVVEALVRAGYEVERRSVHAAILRQDRNVVLVPLRILDDQDLLSIRHNARLTIPEFIALLEPPTLREIFLDSHVRKKDHEV